MAGDPQTRFEAVYDAYADEYLKRVGDTRSLGSVAGVSAGAYGARLVPEYAREGFWRSKAPHTLRGKLGAHHRTLSTYLNTLLAAGFTLRGLREPLLAPGDYDSPFTAALTHIPPVLVIDAALTA